ncbi:S8 family serine peptidase [Propionivibrio limicola]|uniref:S8 family serine peptidase n=1 Tax=Propionivibrio limicola TaxID=167645 RepID=UPI001FE8D129|nr:S8 family serine peptidase [Propionivibrio limicola]
MFDKSSPSANSSVSTASVLDASRRHIPAALALTFMLGAGAIPAAAQTTAPTEKWVPGRLLVQPRAGLSDAEFDKILKPHGGKQVGKIDKINVRIVQLPANASEKAIAALLKHNKHIKFAERDMLVKAEGTANDPYFGSAWHLPKINAPVAWDSSQGSNVTIAILDSGVDPSHPDLAGKLVAGWNFFDNNSNTSDVYGHGTKVAGAAAAATNNSTGVAAVATGASIMPVRVAGTDGYGSWSAIASGLTWAADHGARVANLSFYGVETSSSAVSAAQYMKSKGGLVVTSAGNYGTEATIAPSDSMITVSATDTADVKTSWSSYGSFVDVAAPGAGIWSTVNGGSYAAVSGTSFASPVTAGVVALMMAANPGLAAAEVQKRLYASALDLGTSGFDKYYGNGRVDAAAAVQAAKVAASVDSTAPSVSIGSPTAGSTVKGLVAVDVSASDNVGVSRVDLLVNGTKIASDTTAPFGFSWDSTKATDGSATLAAYAYDAAGNSASRNVTVTVANATAADSQAPVATISNPVDGSTVAGVVAVKATGTDNVAVTSVRLLIDGKQVASTTGTSVSYNWNTKKVKAGTHTIVAEAADAAGNKTTKSIQVVR